VGLERATRL